MKKLISFLLILLLLAVPALVPAEAAAGDTCYNKTWLSGAAYGYNTTLAVLVATDDPAYGSRTQEQMMEEIRFCPFDEAAGLYTAGEGEPAGDRAEIRSLSDNRINYTLRLKEPGKYLISGTAYYLLDSRVPALAALRAELDGAVVKSAKKTEKETAKALHDWFCSRVSPVFPEGEEDRLSAACEDPMNALLTGCASREAYAGLNRLLLSAAGIRCLTVSGIAGDEEASWTLCRLDDTWCWTDAAMDDVKDKKNTKYLAGDDKAFGKDHTLCAADRDFTDTMIRSTVYDALAGGTFSASNLRYAKGNVNYCYPIMDGPSWVVGSSAKVTVRFLGNRMAEFSGKSAEDFMWEHLTYKPWIPDKLWYYNIYNTLDGQLIGDPENPVKLNLFTIEEAADDWSSFTLDIHEPGCYIFTDGYYPVTFYLISPDQAEPAAMAAEMDAAVEKAKRAKTEKETAKQLFQWIRGKVKYNYASYRWEQNPATAKATERDIQTSWDPIGGLICGKAVCGGYSAIYDLLMRQAGLADFHVSGMITPSYESHAWNLNRLDGVWSYTDVTWGRFCWTPEKMNKDHEALLDVTEEEIFFGNAFDLLVRQMEKDSKPLNAIPVALKYLPSSVEDYSFPEKVPQFIRPDVSVTDNRATAKVPQACRLNVVASGDTGKYIAVPGYTDQPGIREFTATILRDKPFRVEICTDPSFPFIKKNNSQWNILYYSGEELISAAWRYVVSDKTSNYPGYSPRYRFYEYDKDMNPVSAGWYMTFTGAKLDFRVYFNTEGKAERYTAEYFSFMDSIETFWEGTPDQVITRLNKQEITDPDEADPRLWEAVWFE